MALRRVIRPLGDHGFLAGILPEIFQVLPGHPLAAPESVAGDFLVDGDENVLEADGFAVDGGEGVVGVGVAVIGHSVLRFRGLLLRN